VEANRESEPYAQAMDTMVSVLWMACDMRVRGI
jgi:hypothetical protein